VPLKTKASGEQRQVGTGPNLSGLATYQELGTLLWENRLYPRGSEEGPFRSGECILTLAIAARRKVLPRLFKLVASVCFSLVSVQASGAQHPQENFQSRYFIERVELIGNLRIETETLLARISSRPGDPYSVEAVRRDVQALWSTQFFDDVRFEVEDSRDKPNGKIVMFSVKEKSDIARIPPTDAASRAKPDKSLPEAFITVLHEVKDKSQVPVLLPSELPENIGRAKHARVVKATVNEYAISLLYRLDTGDAGFAASFAGEARANYSPQELPNVSEVKLAHGIRGFFRSISCGGSCAPANLWWEDGGILYQIQLRLSSRASEQDQEKAITAVANSAILAGPR
jgi:hypothetical protein